MDAATKKRLLQREFEALALEPDTPSWVEPEFIVPVPQAPAFIRRLAELDIGLLIGVEVLERLPDQTMLMTGQHPFAQDRTLCLSAALDFVKRQSAGHCVLFCYDVLDDVPRSVRTRLLRNKPRYDVHVSGDGQVDLRDITDVQPLLDLIWFHVRLLHVTTDSGTLDLTHTPGRFEQMEQATHWITVMQAQTPGVRFQVRGVLEPYTSHLPRERWLLPCVAVEEGPEVACDPVSGTASVSP
ncbi:hypothetical protein [Deinococcus ficus]|jgi:hypothetical protein|uniref:hypothetical protein n=1 Tax=Deinococcus ficus TaxID=317577 RepID=UPI0003B76278|nr:hypothetical protein [Deinococcus ficus]